jgi:hypothetical protein
MKVAADANSDRRHRKLARDQYRNASMIYQALAKGMTRAAIPDLSLGNIDRLARQHRIATNYGWLGATARIERRLLTELESVRTQVDAATLALKPPRSSPPLSIRDVAADLGALETDFAGVVLDRHRQTLSVVTEPIELDEVYLGPFEICLELRGVDQANRYRVIANDPRPASTCDSTTHPHVSDERLCEGCDSCFCSGCLKKCNSCDKPFCDQCLKEDLCDDCLEEKAEKEEAEAAEAAVHTVRVGEAAIPA